MNAIVRTLGARLSASTSSWVSDRRGSVSVEFVLGAVVIITVAVAGMDLYRVIDARSASLHAATTMADYISLEEAPLEAFVQDLAVFSYRNEIALPSEAAFVVSAVGRVEATDADPDPPVVVHWDWKIAVGEDPLSPPAELADSCSRIIADSGDADGALRALAMEPGEMAVVVEVCVRLLPGAFFSGALLSDNVFPTLFYRHRILPVRGDSVPEEPS